jgi:hypothetical protein
MIGNSLNGSSTCCKRRHIHFDIVTDAEIAETEDRPTHESKFSSSEVQVLECIVDSTLYEGYDTDDNAKGYGDDTADNAEGFGDDSADDAEGYGDDSGDYAERYGDDSDDYAERYVDHDNTSDYLQSDQRDDNNSHESKFGSSAVQVSALIPIDKSDVELVVAVLLNLKYKLYLQNSIGNLKSAEKNIKCNLIRNSEFLLWSHLYHHKSALEINNNSVVKWLFDIIQSYPYLLFDFEAYIIIGKALGPTTVLAFVDNFKSLTTWYRLVRPRSSTESEILMTSLDRLKLIFTCIGKKNRKTIRRSKPIDSMQAAIDNKNFPPALLPGLQDEVLKQLPWIRSFMTSNMVDVNANTYNKFCQIMHTAIYAFGPQGRISGIMQMKLKDVQNLLTAVVFTDQLKNAAYFRFQGVCLGDVAREILSIYVSNIRPFAAIGKINDPESALFVKFGGEQDCDPGRYITSFSHTIGLHITSTGIRSMVEIEVDSKYKRGEITSEQRKAVSDSSNHSSQIVKDHYIKIDLTKSLEIARGAVDWRNNQPLMPLAEMTPAEVKVWGTEHPNFGDNKTRIKFSESERRYLMELHTNYTENNTSLNSFSVSYALNHIKKDPIATAIFHERHVLSVDRLRTGLVSLGLLK